MIKYIPLIISLGVFGVFWYWVIFKVWKTPPEPNDNPGKDVSWRKAA